MPCWTGGWSSVDNPRMWYLGSLRRDGAQVGTFSFWGKTARGYFSVTRKRLSEKPIVAFINSIVFILLLYTCMAKHV